MPLGRPSFALPRTMTMESLSSSANLKFGRHFANLSSIVSLVLLGVSITFKDRAPSIKALSSISSDSGLTAFSNLLFYMYLMIGGGVVVFLASILGFWASHYSNRSLIVLYAVFTYAGVGIILAGAVLSNIMIFDMAYILCEDKGCNPRDGNFNPNQLELIATELALFDECCLSQAEFFDEQALNATIALGHADIQLAERRVQTIAFGPCAPSGDIFDQNCDGKTPAIIAEVIDAISPLLCTCVPPTPVYDKVTQTLRNQAASGGGCAALGQAQVKIDADIKVPTTTIGLLGTVAREYKEYFDTAPSEREKLYAPLVGSPAPPYNEAGWPNGGLGCGLGMTKGFLWYVALYVEQSYRPIISAGLTCAVVASVSATLILVFLCLAKSDDLDLLEYDYENGENATKRVTPQAPSEPLKMVAATNPHRSGGSESSGASSSVAGSTVVAKKGDRDALEARINAFYATNEPAKLVNGRIDQDIVNFTLAHGVAALNAKLRAKYGADLDSASAARSSDKQQVSKSNVIAEKIVAKDVDDII